MRHHFARRRALLAVIALLVSVGVAACGATSTTASGAVTVILYDNHIQSSQTTFAPGMRYHFTITNRGTINHEFMIAPQGMSQMPMGQLDASALARTGDMAPGVMKTFDITFTSAMAQQHLEFGCYYPGHYDSGMHMPIAVGASGYGPMGPMGGSGPGGMMGPNGGMMGGGWGSQGQTPAATPSAGVTQVAIQNFAFQPTSIQVKAGTTVTWTNQDSAPHTVTFRNGMKDSGMLRQGQSFSYSFSRLGTYAYYCAYHANMAGAVTVTA